MLVRSPLFLAVLLAGFLAVALPARQSAAQPAPGAGEASQLTVGEHNILRAEGLFSTARQHMRQGRFAEAVPLLQSIIGMTFPADAQARELKAGAHLSLADVLSAQGQLDEAERVAQQGLALVGTDAAPCRLRPELLEFLESLSRKRGDRAKADEYARRAKEARGNAPR